MNVPTVNITPKVRDNGLTDRPNTSAGGSHTVVSGDTLWGSQRNIMGMGHSIRRYMVQIAERLKRQPRAMEKAVPGTGIGFIRVLCFRFLHKGGGRNEITDRRKGYQPAN